MNILGLHFGHDAAVCVLRSGEVAAYVMRERHARIKHAISLECKTIQAAMDEAQLRWDQIDYCAITSTQDVELIIDEPSGFSLSLEAHPGHQAPCTTARLLKAQNINPARLLVHSLMQIFYDPRYANSFHYRYYGHAFPEHRTRQPQDFACFGTLDHFIDSPEWPGETLGQIAVSDYSAFLTNDAVRHGFHYPVTVQLAGHVVPGYFIAHHAAHAASGFYQSGFDHAAILTHDGYSNGVGYLSGMYFWGDAHRIHPLSPNHLAVGGFYEEVGVRLGMGDVGPSGKLMGLAGYGQPAFFEPRFVGNHFDWKQAGVNANAWIEHCLGLAREKGYDLEAFGDPSRARAPINVDIAASTQKVFEETYLVATDTLARILERMGLRTDKLCLSGGCALNCPSNSRIFREGAFREVFVEPGCDDSGVAIGAAGWLFHNVLDHPLPPRRPGAHTSPYRGVRINSQAIMAALHAASEVVEFTPCTDAARMAAEDLASDRVIGWFEGRSEIGPRALGHRSILADPRLAANWARVNALKGREIWRPFAPAVLKSEAERWFQGQPSSSPYMLFTGVVRSHDLPAVTHADSSARIQTVDASCGEFFRLLEFFFAITGVPVLLNTSLNGPGEPIVESPDDAVRFLTESAIDALYMGGFRVVRRRPNESQDQGR